jgi:two-component system response regulator YesN
MERNKRCRAIIIDDEAWIREGLSEYVNWDSLGIELVQVFQDGADAFEFVENDPVDIILSDIRMPHMTGLELIARLRELGTVQAAFSQIKVIFLSGYGDFKYAQEALRLGAVDYLLKPTEVEEIEAALMKAKRLVEEAATMSAPAEPAALGAKAPEEPNSYLIKKAMQIVSQRYAEDVHLTVIANELFVTPNYLSRLFPQETGQSFIAILSEIRLKKACAMLREDMMKIYQVGEAVGYPNSRYFSEWFQKNTGLSPGEYRNRYFRS